MITTTIAPVVIPDSVHSIHAYGFGYLRAGISGLESNANIVYNTKISDADKIVILMQLIAREAATSRALTDAMSEREGRKV
jgi:hypothetical protein